MINSVIYGGGKSLYTIPALAMTVVVSRVKAMERHSITPSLKAGVNVRRNV